MVHTVYNLFIVNIFLDYLKHIHKQKFLNFRTKKIQSEYEKLFFRRYDLVSINRIYLAKYLISNILNI
jgi:hypothetical protein